MLWGLLMPGLREIVRGIVREHLRENAAARAHRYPLPKHGALWATRHPGLALGGIAFAYMAAVALGRAGCLPALTIATLPHSGIRDFWTLNVAIFGAQATLVGLVFPLVIAFVGFLNQGRASFASRLTIYIDASAAIFVGISSLLFCATLAAQLNFGVGGDPRDMAAVSLVNLLWFMVNVGGLAYFVLTTIAFLHPQRRTPLVRAYVANVVWPRELGAILMQERWETAVSHGYLPFGKSLDAHFEEVGARTWYSPFFDGGTPQVLRNLAVRRRLADIRPFLLAPIIRDWLKEAEPLAGDRRHDFIIPVAPGSEYVGAQILARSTLPLGRLARLGIKAAFAFGKSSDGRGEVNETATLLREMSADLIALIDGRQHNEFSVQFEEVTGLHIFLYELAQAKEADLNYSVMGAGRGMFGHMQVLGPSWARAYFDLIGRAVERLPDDPSFVGTIAYTPARIYARAPRSVPPAALRPLILLAEFLGYRLILWAVAEHRAARPGGDGIPHAFTLTRQEENYARAWREFAAGWERLLKEITTGPNWRERGDRDWTELQRLAGNTIAHLRATVELAGRAIWFGDLSATSWACDLLLHWQVQAERAWDTRGDYWRYRTEGLTLPMIERPWPDVAVPTIFPGDPQASPAILFGAIMHNGWRDHLVTLVSLSLHWVIHAEARETAMRAARMLLRNEPHDRGDFGHRDEQPMGAAELLAAILRIRGGGDRHTGRRYAGMIEQLLDQLERIGEAPNVSMRIYSSSGGLAFSDLAAAQVIALMAVTAGTTEISRGLASLLEDPDDEALRSRERHLEAMLEASSAIDYDTHVALVDSLADLAERSFEARRVEARSWIENALARLKEYRRAAIIAAPIDPGKMSRLAEAASAEAFSPKRFPLSQFAAINSAQDALPSHEWRGSGLSKGNFTDPPMDIPFTDDLQWYSDAVADHVAWTTWAEVHRGTTFEERDGRTPESFWAAVRDGSRAMREAGLEPLLVLARAASPAWLRQWRWSQRGEGAPRPADLEIVEGQGEPEGWAFSMNGTKVFEMPGIFWDAFLIPKELFVRLRYRRFADGREVTAGFESDAADPWKGSIVAIYQSAVELADLAAIRIPFSAKLEFRAAQSNAPVDD